MPIIGIDLGTTNSAVGIWENNQVQLIPNRLQEFLTPSIVHIDNGKILVGKSAKEYLLIKPKNTASIFKRYMGTDYKFYLDNKKYTSIELSSFVLKSLKEDAEYFLGKNIHRAVISVPAYFNDIQRKATITAGEIAGLKVEKLINEPTAASIAYSIHEKQEHEKFMVLDLGGGTFDVSIMEYFDGVLEVHSSSGDNFLGGEDFNKILIDMYLEKAKIQSHKLSPNELQKIYNNMEQAKRNFNHKNIISIEQIVDMQNVLVDLDKNEFIKKCQPLLDKIMLPIESSLRDAKLIPSDLSDLILVGGATRMDFLQTMIGKMFRKIPSCRIDPDLVVVMGTAIQAGLKAKDKDLQDIVLTDVSPYSLGVGVYNQNDLSGQLGELFNPIIERNTVVPCSRIGIYTTVSDNQTDIELQIYQGENRLAKSNIRLGKIATRVPKNKKGIELISVRFSYDTNGVLEIDTEVLSTGEKYNKVILSNSSVLNEQDIQKSRERLEKIKFHPRESEENILLIARADRLFASRVGIERDEIAEKTSWFESILETQNVRDIAYARDELVKFLDFIEKDKLF